MSSDRERKMQIVSKRDKKRCRSESPTPSPKRDGHRFRDAEDSESNRDRLEQSRRKRMAKLRAENMAEEKKMQALDEATKRREAGLDFKENVTKKSAKEGIIEVNEEDLMGMDEEEKMQQLLGFAGGFSSTNGAAVDDNQKSASRGSSAKKQSQKVSTIHEQKGRFQSSP